MPLTDQSFFYTFMKLFKSNLPFSKKINIIGKSQWALLIQNDLTIALLPFTQNKLYQSPIKMLNQAWQQHSSNKKSSTEIFINALLHGILCTATACSQVYHDKCLLS